MHIHEWTIDHQIIGEGPVGMPVGECFAYCGCGTELRSGELERRLNAVERLSADEAHLARQTIGAVLADNLASPVPELKDALFDYAYILEKEIEVKILLRVSNGGIWDIWSIKGDGTVEKEEYQTEDQARKEFEFLVAQLEYEKNEKEKREVWNIVESYLKKENE